MTDLAVRLSVLMATGHICSKCGIEISAEGSGGPRQCEQCVGSVDSSGEGESDQHD
jgi:hypothetical protein